MGIKGLFQFLKSVDPSIFRTEKSSLLRYKKVAVDAYGYLYRLKFANNEQSFKEQLINFVLLLRELQIHPLFVFDGPSIAAKSEELLKRHTQRQIQRQKIKQIEEELHSFFQLDIIDSHIPPKYFKLLRNDKDDNTGINSSLPPLLKDTWEKYSTDIFDFDEMVAHLDNKILRQQICVSQADILLLQEILDCFNIPWVVAEHGDGELFCAQLCREKKVFAVLSQDSDVLATCCPILIRKLGTTKMDCVCIEDVLASLELKEEEFRDFCIMCGTDFNHNIPRIGPKKSYALIQKHRMIHNIPPSLNTDILKYETTRDIFNPSSTLDYHVALSKTVRYDQLEPLLSDTDLTIEYIQQLLK